MNSSKLEASPLVSEEDDYSGDDDRSGEGRRRFCIERKHRLEPAEPISTTKPKRAKTVTRQARPEHDKYMGKRRKVYKEQRQRQIITINCTPIKNEPLGPVIFINPNLVKKFIAKSINLASSTAQTSSQTSFTLSSDVIKDIDFKSSPEESLKAACTMAIIRLVTECIEDCNKRDEKFNKILASRLLEGLA